MKKILQVKNLRVRFPVHGGVLLRKVAEVKAVDGISFDLLQGETLGLVGESGCGKSTVGRAIVNILRAMNHGVEISGQILYQTKESTIDLVQLSRSDMRPHRAAIQMIFQDPYSSLNPRLTVRQIIEEPIKIHTHYTATERYQHVMELLEKVGLSKDHASRYPHEFSGGQRQRIGIARALSTRPKIVIADEPVSALDVSIQAQVINLMQELQEEFNLSYIFIAHDLSVVRHISDRIAVMYLGEIVEIGPGEQVYKRPLHPYSQALLSAVPQPDPQAKHTNRITLSGDVPSPIRKPTGCAFHNRCPVVQDSCSEEVPALEIREDRAVACPFV